MLSDSRSGSDFDGSNNGFASTTSAIAGPDTFGVEAWFKTTTTNGGKIVGFGSSSTGTSGSYDRHVYMEPSGRVTFGVYPGSSQTISSSTAFNDGQWHYMSAGLSDGGMVLYIDGIRVAQRTDVTSAQPYNGYWRVGGDTSWAGAAFFDGDIDEVAIYGAPLTRQQAAAHYTASGRELEGSTAPADAYGAAVYAADPALYWRLGESTGSVAADASGYNQKGNYFGAVAKGANGASKGSATRPHRSRADRSSARTRSRTRGRTRSRPGSRRTRPPAARSSGLGTAPTGTRRGMTATST